MQTKKSTVLPNFLIVGAARSGTTALYHFLNQHPQIAFPSLKEPKFFSSKHLSFPHSGPGDSHVDQFAIKSFSKYEELFEGFGNYKMLGDASPDYLYYHNYSAPEIKKYLGDVPIIITLRNPVYRAFSAYSYLVRDSREKLSFREALKAEEDRLKKNWDFIWAYKKTGEYYKQVKTFLELFSRVKIIIHKNFKLDPKNTIDEIFAFLNIDQRVELDTDIQHNKSGKPNNFLSKFILSRKNVVSTRVREFLKANVPRKILQKIANKSIRNMKINNTDKKYLENYFGPVNDQLFDLLGYEIGHWNYNTDKVKD